MLFPDTWVWVLQFLLEPGERRAQGLWILQKHLVHDQHSFFSDVWFSVGHLGWENSKDDRGRELCSNCFKKKGM